jgi:ADP-ribosyl-[dinitrogen reductase] hydrolase
MITPKMRFEGCLIGLGVGDAVGTTVEFKSPGSFPPVTDMVGGGPFHLKAGEWTDDTSMALCLAESLVKSGGFNAQDQMERYVRWWREGYLSSNGRCFDIGNTVASALREFSQTGEPFAGSTDRFSAGNGSLMRLAPVPLYFSSDPTRAIAMSGESSKTTHGATACVDACRYFGALVLGATMGCKKEEILSERYAPVQDIWDRMPLCPEIDAVACGSFKEKNPSEIVGSGYVVASLEAALWAFFKSSDFRDGCLMVVNLGNDADTTSAIYGQIAGAYYGVSAIPESWRNRLAHLDLITQLAQGLYNERMSPNKALHRPADRHR